MHGHRGMDAARAAAAGALLVILSSGGAACGGQFDVIGGDGGNGDAGVDSGSEAAASVTTDCTTIDGGAGPLDPSIQDTVSGTNGVFVDSCDPSGNLVDYLCETRNICGPGPNPGCTQVATGAVISQTVDCSGHCIDGRCDGRCPDFDQRVDFVSVGAAGSATIHNDTDGRAYACTLVFDAPNDAFDCMTDPHAGSTATISSLGLQAAYCTGKGFGAIGLKFDGVTPVGNEACTYQCSIP